MDETLEPSAVTLEPNDNTLEASDETLEPNDVADAYTESIRESNLPALDIRDAKSELICVMLEANA